MQSGNDNEAANPFGALPYSFNFIKTLCKAQTTANLLFTHYVNCRANAKRPDGSPWRFIRADIERNCGLHYAVTRGMCAAFVKAGLFTPAGTTSRGSLAFELNKEKFEAYLKDLTPVEPITDKQELDRILGDFNLPDLPTESFERDHNPLNDYGDTPSTIKGVSAKTPVAAKDEKKRIEEKKRERGEDSGLPVSHSHSSDAKERQETRSQPQCPPSATTGAGPASSNDTDRLGKVNLSFNLMAAPCPMRLDPAEVVKAEREKVAEEIGRRELARWEKLRASSVSPLEDKEDIADLPVTEKLAVFKAGVQAIIRRGGFGRLREPVNYADIVPEQHIRYHFEMTGRGEGMLADYLAAHPSVTAAGLLVILDNCCMRAATSKKKDEGYRENNQEIFAGENLTSFVQYLNTDECSEIWGMYL